MCGCPIVTGLSRSGAAHVTPARGIVASMLVPPLCWGCGGVARRREPLCAGCRRLLRRLGPDPVLLCGVPVWAPVAYSGPARDLVRALKFRGATAVADAMAAQIAANAPAALLAGVLVPVPLHPRRLRRRGYNQAALIADALARRAGARGRGLPRAHRVGRHAGGPRPRRAARRPGRERRAARRRCRTGSSSSTTWPRPAPRSPPAPPSLARRARARSAALVFARTIGR